MSRRRPAPTSGARGPADEAAKDGGLYVRLGDIPTAGRQERLLSIPGLGVSRVVLDLSGLPAIEASTLGSILLLRQALRAAGGGLRLRGCSDAVTSALRGMHLERILCPEEE